MSPDQGIHYGERGYIGDRGMISLGRRLLPSFLDGCERCAVFLSACFDTWLLIRLVPPIYEIDADGERKGERAFPQAGRLKYTFSNGHALSGWMW